MVTKKSLLSMIVDLSDRIDGIELELEQADILSLRKECLKLAKKVSKTTGPLSNNSDTKETKSVKRGRGRPRKA